VHPRGCTCAALGTRRHCMPQSLAGLRCRWPPTARAHSPGARRRALAAQRAAEPTARPVMSAPAHARAHMLTRSPTVRRRPRKLMSRLASFEILINGRVASTPRALSDKVRHISRYGINARAIVGCNAAICALSALSARAPSQAHKMANQTRTWLGQLRPCAPTPGTPSQAQKDRTQKTAAQEDRPLDRPHPASQLHPRIF